MTRELLDAEEVSAQTLADKLSAQVPDDWPPDLYDDHARMINKDQLYTDPEYHDWLSCYIIHNEPPPTSRSLVGIIGYGAFKADEQTVMTGYSVCENHRNKGYATEALSALTEWAFRQFHISRIIADTFPHLLPSIRVLEKNGFQRIGIGGEEGTIRFELLREK